MWPRGVVVITTAQLHLTMPEVRFCVGSNPARGVFGDSQWWGPLTMVPAGNKAKCLSSVNHTTKTIHHHHHQYQQIRETAYLVKFTEEVLKKTSFLVHWFLQWFFLCINLYQQMNLWEFLFLSCGKVWSNNFLHRKPEKLSGILELYNRNFWCELFPHSCVCSSSLVFEKK